MAKRIEYQVGVPSQSSVFTNYGQYREPTLDEKLSQLGKDGWGPAGFTAVKVLTPGSYCSYCSREAPAKTETVPVFYREVDTQEPISLDGGEMKKESL